MQHMTETVGGFLRALQEEICSALQELEPDASFGRDAWSRAEGGGGVSRILEGGQVFERAGVGLSDVHGKKLPPSASSRRPELAGRPFRAMGVSLVIHPRNPYVPSSHANLRFFSAGNAHDPAAWWFGGGFDLTPYYGFEQDVIHWHQEARAACEVLGGDSYAKYKRWCDEYFYLPHRDETRGVGGLFFDDLNEPDFQTCLAFARSVGSHYLSAYLPIVRRRMDTPWKDRERNFQLYRRGRYVEFNLVYDRGTLFGLQSGGRTESILMSLPPEVRWRYDWRPAEGSPESELYTRFLKPRDWLEESGGT